MVAVAVALVARAELAAVQWRRYNKRLEYSGQQHDHESGLVKYYRERPVLRNGFTSRNESQ